VATLDSLPPDQRAVLELVLARGRSYDEIAKLLSVDRAGVRERALAAFDALGPRTGVPAERRALITDYLLGALPPLVADDVREHLASSPSERAWARVVASELQPLASKPLPEIPVESAARADKDDRDDAGEPEPAASEPRTRRPLFARREPAAAPAAAASAEPREKPAGPRTSRTGGAILLAVGAAIAVAVVLVVVLTSGGSSKKGSTSTAASRPSTASTPTTASTTPQVIAQINLNPPSGGAAKGIAEVLRSQGKKGIAIVAQGLAANTKKPPNAYAVWLYNSPTDSKILGFVNPGVGTNGRLQTAGGLPINASHFQKLLVTLETQSNPKSPGTIVLEGPLTGV
jgi:hypothetical protein